MLYKETQASLVASNKVGLEQIAEKMKYISMSFHQCVGQDAV